MKNKRIKLTDILESIEFSYVINNDNTFSLRDCQDCNLGDIESDKFDIDNNLAMNVIDRIGIYINDYYLSDIAERLRVECQDNIDITENYEVYLEKMQKYPEVFKNDIETMQTFVNPNLLDISDIIETSKIKIKCFRCGTRLQKSLVKGYTYFCPECYEDFYRFEQETKKGILQCISELIMKMKQVNT